MKDRYRVLIGFVKLGLYLSMAATFFLLMGLRLPNLLLPTQMTAVIMLTYLVMSGMFLAIYGGYDIGKKSKRAVENAILVNSWLTDLLTFAQLMILNWNEMDGQLFLQCVGMFLFVIAFQGVEVLLLMNLGFRIYHYATRDIFTLYIVNREIDQEKLLAAIEAAVEKRPGDAIVDYRDPDLYAKMEGYANIFISEVPIAVRKRLIEFSYGHNKNILFTPEINDIVEYSCEYRMFNDTLILSSPKKVLSLSERVIKRTMDIVGSLILLVLSSPLFLIATIMIKCDDGGRVFFTQTRATKDGKPFRIFKFRTMVENDATTPMIENDTRITRAGNFLRRTRIDEIPQFLNVLIGDMSLVGPRPEQLVYLHGFDQNYPEYEYRLRVKAGMTGFAQIEGKYNTTNKEKLILDLMYIQSYSLWLDLKLILQTLLVMLKEDSTEGF